MSVQDEHDVQMFMREARRASGFTSIPLNTYVDSLVMSDKTMSPYFIGLLLQRGLVSVPAADLRAAAERLDAMQFSAALRLKEGAANALLAAVEVAKSLQTATKGAEQ